MRMTSERTILERDERCDDANKDVGKSRWGIRAPQRAEWRLLAAGVSGTAPFQMASERACDSSLVDALPRRWKACEGGGRYIDRAHPPPSVSYREP